MKSIFRPFIISTFFFLFFFFWGISTSLNAAKKPTPSPSPYLTGQDVAAMTLYLDKDFALSLINKYKTDFTQKTKEVYNEGSNCSSHTSSDYVKMSEDEVAGAKSSKLHCVSKKEAIYIGLKVASSKINPVDEDIYTPFLNHMFFGNKTLLLNRNITSAQILGKYFSTTQNFRVVYASVEDEAAIEKYALTLLPKKERK